MSHMQSTQPGLEAVDYDPFAEAPAYARAVPSTEAQREIWLACQLGENASLAYNEAVSLCLRGALDLSAFRAALHSLVARHDALRACFSDDGQQMLVAERVAVDLPVHDLVALDDEQREVALRGHARVDMERPFDLARGPLVRMQLLALGAKEWRLLLTAHHIVCDGWSFGVLLQDLAALYALELRQPAALRDPVSFADFAVALAERERGAAHADDERFWTERFRDIPAPLELPLDHARPARRGFASARIDHVLPAGLVERLRAFGATQGASLFSVLLGGFAALMQRLAACEEVVVGVPAAGQTLEGFGHCVGHAVNLLPLRLAPDPHASLAAALPQVQSRMLDAYEHQHYTFGTLLKRLLVPRDPSRVPLAQVMFNLDSELPVSGFPGLLAEAASVPRGYENFELFVNAVPHAGSIRLECQYAASLFDAATVRRWLQCLELLLAGSCERPGTPLREVDLVSEHDRAELLRLNATAEVVPGPSLLHAWLHRRSAVDAARVVLEAGEARLDHDALWHRAWRIAHALRGRGVGRGQFVGVCLERGKDLLPAVLGVLASGAAYVPLDPGFPQARLTDMANDAGLALLLTESACAEALPWERSHSLWLDSDASEIEAAPATEPAPDVARDAEPESPAYMIYTSGSTGRPKGVMLPHRAVVCFLHAVAGRPGLREGERLLAVTTLSFDIAVLELMLPLATGGCVVLASREQSADGFALRALLERARISAMQATPSTWRMLFEAGWSATAGFKALVGGEALARDLADALLGCCAEVWNMYGPTEATVWSSCWRVRAEVPVSIGTPLANERIWVLDELGQPCPIGVPGEIVIGGAGVALGYWQRPELNADRFVPDPFGASAGERMYRTGDRGRWRNDGLLEHLGRLDFQVKLRGYRIELGEIEARLGEHAQVRQALAMVREDVPGDARLVAYVVPRVESVDAARQDWVADLRRHLGESLPGYMIPQHFVPLPRLPLLPNGKIDRKALPSPLAGGGGQGGAVKPRRALTRTETVVAQAMEQALQLPGIGPDDDFFALGGHSLLAAQLAARLREQSGLDLQMLTVFAHPSVSALAAWMERGAGAEGTRAETIPARADQTTAPASLQQWRVWFLEQLDPGRPTFNTPSAHRLQGPLDVEALERALNAMVERQASLRTAIVENDEGVPVQVVLPRLQVRLGHLHDLSALAPERREAELAQRLQAAADEPFDLRQAPLFRVSLWRLDAQEHVLFFMPHHIVWDGWSFDLIYDEMKALYAAFAAGREPGLPALRLSYGDYAAWQARWLQSADLQRQLAYWRDVLTPMPEALELPGDRPRPPSMSGRGATHWLRQDQPWFQALEDFARTREMTPFMVLLATFAVFLCRESGQHDLVIATPVRGRPSVELEPLMGFFVNVLPLRIRVDEAATFEDLLRHVREVVLAAFAAPDVPFERLLQLESVVRDDSRTPIYQSFFSYQDARRRDHAWGALRQQNVPLYQSAAAEDLRLWFMVEEHGVVGGLTYNTDVFDATRVEAWLQRYLGVLQHLCGRSAEALRQVLPPGVVPALPPRGDVRPQSTTTVSSQAPARALSPGEAALAEIWRDMLGVSSVRPDDNFFDLGGHSLLVIQAIARMRKNTGKAVPPRAYVLESLAQLALRYEQAPVEQGRGGLLRRLFGTRDEQ